MKKKILSFVLAALMLVSSVPLTAQAAKKDDSMFDNFITVEDTKLMDGDEELRFISLNYPQATSDNAWEHANAMKTIKAMGGNVTRTYTIPVYNGFNEGKAYVTGVENGKLTFNEDALNELDDVLAKANKYGVRVIIPLVDHWHWIGGMDSYVWLAGESEGNAPSNSGFQSWAWNFYSSETCRDYFKQMISHLMERKNSVTGVKYKEDKAILCWETANEAGGNPTNQKNYDDVLSDWTIDITNHIKSCDKNHLVLDGRMSTTEQSRSENNPADILGAHFYEGNYATRCADETKACHEAGKPFILGEFGGKVEAKPCIDVFQKGIENDTNGIMMWSLRAHKDGYGYYFHDEDGYWAAYHWPGFEAGSYYGETEILRAIYAYAQIVNGNADNYEEAKEIPIPAPEKDEAPLLYSADSNDSHDKSFLDGSVGDIKWRGVVGGAWYEIQRAEGKVTENNADTADWTFIATKEDYVYDSGRNWEDKNHDCIAGFHDETAIDGKTYSYRLRACNESGKGLWSNIVTVKKANHVVVDDLDLIAVSSKDQNPTEIRNTYSYGHSANVTQSGSVITNSSDTLGYIEYKETIPLESIEMTAVSEVAEENQPRVYVSKNGITYEEIQVAHENETKTYTAASNGEDSYYVRIYLPGKNHLKLDSIKLIYENDGKHYLKDEDNIDFKSNVVIQDNDFSSKDSAHFVYTDENSVIYKTADDINAIRVKAADGVTVEYSYDGIEFKSLEGTADSGIHTFKNFNLEDSIRVVRIVYTDLDSLKSVEISSGKKSIPASDVAPFNILEDGEYYFGNEDSLKENYTVSTSEGRLILEKNLGDKDYSNYDSIFAWAKGMGCNVKLELIDGDGNYYKSGSLDMTSDGEMSKLMLDSYAIDLRNVKKLRFVVVSNSGKEITSGKVRLDDENSYTGNYCVAVDYTVDGGEKNTIYLDCIYANSSTAVDDFEGYGGSDSLLNAAYDKNSNGGSFELSLDSSKASEGTYAMRIDYDYQGKGYAGAAKKMDLLNLDGYDGFFMHLYSDGSGNDLKLQVENDVSTFAYTGYLTPEGDVDCFLPFSGFKECDWAGSGHELDSSNNLKSVAIYTDKIGNVESGTFYIDDIKGSNYVEGANDLLAKKEDKPAEDEPDDGTVKETVFTWNFDENGTEGWVFDGFSPWVENGKLCAWSQDEYQAVFSYTVEDVPNGTYSLANDIKVKSNMRNVQMALASGDEEIKSDAIDTNDAMEEGVKLDKQLEVTNNTITIKYYLDSPKDDNGTTFMVNNIKLVCTTKVEKEEPTEEPTEEPEENPAPKPAPKPAPAPSTPTASAPVQQPVSQTTPETPAVTETTVIEEPETPLAVITEERVVPKTTVKTETVADVEQIEETVSEDEQVIEDTEDIVEEVEDNSPTEIPEGETPEAAEESVVTEETNNVNTILIIVGLMLIISMGVGITLWRRKHI